MFRNPDETLALVFEILHENKLPVILLEYGKPSAKWSKGASTKAAMSNNCN